MLEHLIVEGGHAARFFPVGATVDICEGPGLRITQTHQIALSVWRSDGATVIYFDA
jgi:hypothetical protein